MIGISGASPYPSVIGCRLAGYAAPLLLVIALLLLADVTPLSAQVTGSITGRILGSVDAPLSGATIRLAETQRGAIADRNGRFSIGDLPAGSYQLLVNVVGYQPYRQTVTVRSNQTSEVTIRMRERIITVDDVVVTGTSEAQSKRDAAIKIEVVDLRGMQVQSADVAQVLSRAPGTNIRQEGGMGSEATININGLQGRAVRLFKDDIPVDYLGRGFDLSTIPINSLDRIEVYKGAMPVSLGADALGGGINFVSKKGYRSYADLSYEIGSFNTHRVALNTHYVLDTAINASVSANGYYATSDNDYEVEGSLIDTATSRRYPATVRQFHDGVRSYFGEITGGVEDLSWADRLAVGVVYSMFHKDFQYGALMTTPYGEAFGVETALVPSLRYTKTFAGALRADLFVTRSWLNTRLIDTSSNRYAWDGSIISTGGKGGEINDYKTNQEIDWTYTLGRSYLNWSIADGHSVDFNYNFIRQERIGSNPTGPKNFFTGDDPLSLPAYYTRNILGSSYTAELPELGLTNVVALKYFTYEASGFDNLTFGSYDTVGIHTSATHGGIAEAIKFSPFPSLLLRASYEYANRLPERDELFGDGLLTLSNYALRPERSHNINVGGRYTDDIGASSYLVEANLFYRDAEDLIALMPQGPFAIYENLNAALILGVELDLSLNLFDAFTIGGNATYQDIRRTEIADPNERYLEGSRVPNIPYFFYNANARFRQKDLFLGGASLEVYWYYSYVHQFYLHGIARELEPASLWEEAKVSTDLVIPSQAVHSVGFSYALPGDIVSLAFEASNLFNEKTYDNFKIQKPGRVLHLKLRSLLR